MISLKGSIEDPREGASHCRVRFRDRVMCRLRVMVTVTVRVRFPSQEAPGTEITTIHLSPRSDEWSAQGRVPVRNGLWVPRPDNCMGCFWGRPPKCSLVASIGFANDMVMFQVPCQVFCTVSPIRGHAVFRFGFGSSWL